MCIRDRLKTVVPVKDKKKAKSGRRILLNVDQLQAASWLEQFRRRKYKAKIRLLEALVERPELTDEYVSKELKIPGETLKSLAEQGIIRLEQFTVYRNPIGESDVLVQEKEAPGLTAEQQEVSASNALTMVSALRFGISMAILRRSVSH